MAAIYVKVNGRYVAIPTLKGDTSDVSNDIISDAQSIVLPPSVKAIKDYVDDELDDALISAINSGDLVIAFNKYSDLPETGHYAYVRTNETTSASGSVELVDGNSYTLYINPIPNYDGNIYGFYITGATGFDDNRYNVFNGAGTVLSILGIKGTKTHIWQYGAFGETLYDGWWYLVREFGETISAVKIDYSELPILSGTVSHNGSALNLGFPLASETPYNTNEFGLYRYDETLEQWIWTDSGYFENQGVLGLFATTNGELTYDGEPIGYKISTAEILEKFSEVNDQLYFDGLPISGVNIASYDYANDLDNDANLIIAQTKKDQTLWRTARTVPNAQFTLVAEPLMPIEDFTASITKDGEEIGTLDFSANNPDFSDEGIGSMTVSIYTSPTSGTVYFYVEHTTTLNEFDDLEITAGWNKLTISVVDGNLVIVGDILHYPETFSDLPSFTGCIINTDTPSGVNEFITTNSDNTKDDLKWIRYAGLYVLTDNGDWNLISRQGASTYIAETYNFLPNDAVIGSTATVKNDAEQDKVPEQFETGVTYDYWYFKRDPVIPEITIEAMFDCNYNGIGYASALRAGATALLTNDVSGGTSGFYVQLVYSDEVFYKYYIIYTVEAFTATIEGETIALSAGWNGVRADYADDVWTLTDLNLTFETLPILSDCFIEPLNTVQWAYYLDGFFSTTPYVTRKAGGYTLTADGWAETVCIDPAVLASLALKENLSNKVTTIDENSTDDEYPSAKAVYEYTPDLSGYEELANKVTTIDVDSTDTEYPSAKAVYDFVPEVDLVPTMTEYDTVLTLNNGNYWTTTASIEFALPTPTSGKVNTFDLLVKVADGGHAVTFSAAVEWAGSVAYVFGVGTHKVCGEYDPINSKWLLTATAGGVPA